MKNIKLHWALLPVAALILMFGCGGGSGGGTPPATSVVLTLSTSGTLPTGTLIGGVDTTIVLPAGLTLQSNLAKAVKATASKVVTYSGVLTPSGVAASANAMALASSSVADHLNVKLANPAGFPTGEFVTATFSIPSGATYTDADFSASGTIVDDLNGVPITGITVGITAVMQ